MDKQIKAINESARKLFGADTSILVARAPAFGNRDACVIVMGKRHADAARHFALAVRGARIQTVAGVDFLSNKPTAHSTVEWEAL